MKKRIGGLMVLTALLTVLHAGAQESEKTLQFGDPMPELQGVDWLKGRDPVADTEGDRPDFVVYDCWATWCGPCIESIPHLNELAEKHAGRVAIAGIAVWDERENVNRFLEKTGDELTYAIGFDEQGVVAEKLMKAAGQDGIPCAFVAETASNTLLWYGHPMNMDNALQSMLEGTYDAAKARANMEAELDIQALIAEGRWDDAQKRVDAWKEQDPDKAAVFSLWIQVQKKDAEGTEKALNEIMQREVPPSEAMNIMGLMVLALDRFPDAVDLQATAVAGAEKIAAQNADHVLLQGMYWYALNAAKRYDDARAVADQMLVLAWDDPARLNDLAQGMLLDEVGDQYYEQAEKAMKRARELSGDSADFSMPEFKLAALRGDREAVQRAADLLLAQEGADPELINTAAWELMTNRRIEGDYAALALMLAEKAEALTMGENPAILDTLALAMFKNGHVERAVEIEKNAIELAPQYDFLKMQLAMFEDALEKEGAEENEQAEQPDGMNQDVQDDVRTDADADAAETEKEETGSEQ